MSAAQQGECCPALAVGHLTTMLRMRTALCGGWHGASMPTPRLHECNTHMLWLGVMAAGACLTVTLSLRSGAPGVLLRCLGGGSFCIRACANNGVGWLLNLRATGQLRGGRGRQARCSPTPVL